MLTSATVSGAAFRRKIRPLRQGVAQFCRVGSQFGLSDPYRPLKELDGLTFLADCFEVFSPLPWRHTQHLFHRPHALAGAQFGSHQDLVAGRHPNLGNDTA